MFPPILTNRTLNSTNLPTVDESRCSLSPKDATTSNIDTEPMADLNDAEQMLSVQATKKQNKFFFTCPDIQREQSPERSDYSDYVDDDWSSIEDGENPRASREAQVRFSDLIPPKFKQ
uniref:AGC-kinase C-terminal domain-containing protein n=1 Tax=Globodera pallida TaxID=36090 RepID=A0A183C8Z6_GLOPA